MSDPRLAKLVLTLRGQGVTDPAVLNAIERTPRDLFTQEIFKERSFEDQALPIECGQTISQPYIVGLMTQALTLEPRARVLEIGTGSGYQTAVLSRLSRLVYTVERYRTLMKQAEARFATLGLTNIITKFGDGGLGWAEQAPFDRIMVTAAAPGEPKAPTNRPSRSRMITGDIDERGRLPGATALAAGRPSASTGEKAKSVIWLLRKKPPAIRPEPNRLSTVVVIETASPHWSTMTKWLVPAGSRVTSGARSAGAPGGVPAPTGPVTVGASAARSAT